MTDHSSPANETSLLPCPFCSSETVQCCFGVGATYAVECQSCETTGPRCMNKTTAADAWNARSFHHAQRTPSVFYLAQLRHAYTQLAAGTVKNQKEFADGLIAPAIRDLEQSALTSPDRRKKARPPFCTCPGESDETPHDGSPCEIHDAAAIQPQQMLSEEERHAIAHARYQVGQASMVKPDCCFDYELVKDLLRVIDRQSALTRPKLCPTEKIEDGQS